MNRAPLKRQALEKFRHDLEPGEHIVAGAAVTSDPSRWGAAILLILAVAMTAAGLVSLLGSLNTGPLIVILVPILGLGIQFLPRPMYVAVTERRLICSPKSRLRDTPKRWAFAVPFTDLRILNYRSGKYGASIRLGSPGRKPILVRVGRAGRKDFAEVEMVLASSGALAKLDPPYPSAEILSTAAGLEGCD